MSENMRTCPYKFLELTISSGVVMFTIDVDRICSESEEKKKLLLN